jgi:glucose/mannose-6-phosphate isomerase
MNETITDEITTMQKLDSKEEINNIDPSGMYDKIYNFPEQLEEAARIGLNLNPDLNYFKGIANIVVIGMGGSAIGGDLVRSYLADKINIPFFICRHYRLPEFVNENSLVIGSSYSGNTEESLSAFNDALSRKAKIACITTGGKLGELAQKNNFLVAKLPKGYPPRAALGFSFIPLLCLMSRLGFINDVEKDISELVKELKSWRDLYSIDMATEKNRAKSLAVKFYNKIPIIYTGPELTDAIGTRWKGQICENSKCLAFNNQFPEFNHNELVGWNVIEAYRDKIIVVYLKDHDDHDRVSKRMSVVKQIIEKQKVEIVEVNSRGTSPLARMFSLIQIGDFTSFYLAILNNIDPTPVKVIDFLKDELTK